MIKRRKRKDQQHVISVKFWKKLKKATEIKRNKLYFFYDGPYKTEKLDKFKKSDEVIKKWEKERKNKNFETERKMKERAIKMRQPTFLLEHRHHQSWSAREERDLGMHRISGNSGQNWRITANLVKKKKFNFNKNTCQHFLVVKFLFFIFKNCIIAVTYSKKLSS